VSRIAARTPVNEPMIPNNSAVFKRMSKLLAIEALDILHFSMHLSLEGPLDPGASYWTRDSRGGGWSVLAEARILAKIEWVRNPGRWRAWPRGRIRWSKRRVQWSRGRERRMHSRRVRDGLVWLKDSIQPTDLFPGPVATFEIGLGSSGCDGRGRKRRENWIVRSLHCV
jgi:hypothetical protein